MDTVYHIELQSTIHYEYSIDMISPLKIYSDVFKDAIHSQLSSNFPELPCEIIIKRVSNGKQDVQFSITTDIHYESIVMKYFTQVFNFPELLTITINNITIKCTSIEKPKIFKKDKHIVSQDNYIPFRQEFPRYAPFLTMQDIDDFSTSATEKLQQINNFLPSIYQTLQNVVSNPQVTPEILNVE